MSKKLPITENLDFAYLLELMPPLHDIPEFAWLPELFSIIGYESLIKLCKYAGGETIQIPTLSQLTDSIEALQIFYDTYIAKVRSNRSVVPAHIQDMVQKIMRVYSNVTNDNSIHT